MSARYQLLPDLAPDEYERWTKELNLVEMREEQGTDLRVDQDGKLTFRYKNEADIRDNLAHAARIYGWNVETERHVPNWGRLDLFITDGHTSFAVEIKTNLDRPAKIRKAFQQADGYGRWLAQRGHQAVSCLVAAEIDTAISADVEMAYPEVHLFAAFSFLNTILANSKNGHPQGRLYWARLRCLDQWREAQLSLQLLRELEHASGFEGEPS